MRSYMCLLVLLSNMVMKGIVLIVMEIHRARHCRGIRIDATTTPFAPAAIPTSLPIAILCLSQEHNLYSGTMEYSHVAVHNVAAPSG